MKRFIRKFNESKKYQHLYHLLGFDNMVYMLEHNRLSPYRAGGGYISFTTNRMMNGYIGEDVTTFFKLEIDWDKLSEKYETNPYTYVSMNGYKFSEHEERVKGEIENISEYITKIILIKSKIEYLKKPTRNTKHSDYYTTGGNVKNNIPYMIKYIMENTNIPLYVQDDRTIMKDDVYLKSLVDFKLTEVKYKYEIAYRGYTKNPKVGKYGKTEIVVYDNGDEYHGELVVGMEYDNRDALVDLSDINWSSIDYNKTYEGETESMTPYLFKYRIGGDDSTYLEQIILLTPKREREFRALYEENSSDYYNDFNIQDFPSTMKFVNPELIYKQTKLIPGANKISLRYDLDSEQPEKNNPYSGDVPEMVTVEVDINYNNNTPRMLFTINGGSRTWYSYSVENGVKSDIETTEMELSDDTIKKLDKISNVYGR